MTKIVRTKFRTPEYMAMLFFKKVFPEKIRNGKVWDKIYFDEWVHRFSTGHPETYADFNSLRVIQKLRKQGYVWGS